MIYFDSETRQFSNSYDRYTKRRYGVLRAHGYTHEGAIDRLKDEALKARQVTHVINGAGALASTGHLLGYNKLSRVALKYEGLSAEKLKKANRKVNGKTIATGAGILAVHGGLGYLTERAHKKHQEAIEKVSKMDPTKPVYQ